MKTRIAIGLPALLTIAAIGQTTNRISDLNLVTSLSSTDRVNVIQWTGVASATGSMYTNKAAEIQDWREYLIANPVPILMGSELFVSTNGSDTTGVRGDAARPFLTLTRAFEVKVAGDRIVMGPGVYDFAVTVTDGATTETNRIVSNFALIGAGKGLTTINVIPRGTNEHNRVLSVPASTPVTNVLFSGFTLDGNASDYAWDTGGKLDWILWGQNIDVDGVEVVDWGGHSSQEAFSPLLQNVTNALVTHSVFRSTGSLYTAGPTAMDSAHVKFSDNFVADYNIAFGLVNALYDIEISRNQITNVNYFINNDTATSGSMNVRILDNSASGDTGSAVRGIQVTYGGKQRWRIERNTLAYFPQGIWIRSPDSSGTNYFLNGVIADNFIPASTLLGISLGEATNNFIRNNKVYFSGSFPATNYVAGSNNYGWGHVKPDGSLWADLPNTLQGAGGGITLTASGFDGNLATSDDTLQEVAQKVDDLVLGSGSVDDTAYDATSWNGVTTVAPSKNAVRDKIESMSAGSGDDVWVNGSNVTHPDFDNTASSGTVTPTTFSVSGTNVTLTIGNAGATAAGAVTTGAQAFAGHKTFNDGITVAGSGAGAAFVADADQSHYGGLMANATTTTDTILNLPAAPFAGYVQFAINNVTNWVPSQVAFGVGLLGSDVSHNPVDVDTKAELDTALGGTDLALATGDTYTGTHDFGGATLEVPNSDDPDVSTTGQMAWDTDGWMRVYDGANQVAVARTIETIQATIVAPNDLADAVRDAALIWSNESGMSFVVTGWKGWSGTDDTTLNIEETDGDGANNATVDAVELATNGTGVFYGSDTTITAATIENGHLLWLDFDDTDTPTYVKVTIYGYYDANVN